MSQGQWNLEPETSSYLERHGCLGSNSDSAICWLCALGQLTQPLWASVFSPVKSSKFNQEKKENHSRPLDREN